MDIQDDLLAKACRIIENNCPRSHGLGRKSRIPKDRSFSEGIRNMAALVSTTGSVGLIFRSSAASSIPSRPGICRSVMTKSIRSGILLKQRQRLARILTCLGLIATRSENTCRITLDPVWPKNWNELTRRSLHSSFSSLNWRFPLLRIKPTIPTQLPRLTMGGFEWIGLACWPISPGRLTRNCYCAMNIWPLKTGFLKPDQGSAATFRRGEDHTGRDRSSARAQSS